MLSVCALLALFADRTGNVIFIINCISVPNFKSMPLTIEEFSPPGTILAHCDGVPNFK